MSVLLKSQEIGAGHDGALTSLGVNSPETKPIRRPSRGPLFGLSIRRNLVSKRIFDVALAIPMLIFSLPLIGLCALLIKLFNSGPAFYSQERIGKDGKLIHVLKLRTMVVDSDDILAAYLQTNPAAKAQWENCFKLDDDPRIIPYIGHFLRKSSFDELPQLLNVVRGDMSLVGPRPFPAYHLSAFSPAFRKLRQSVPPGLTGLWQIGPRSAGGGDIEAQETHDTDYIKNWSFSRDLWILLQTARVVSRGGGR